MRRSCVPKLLVLPMIIALAACSEEKETAPPIRPVLSSVIELSNLPTPSFAGTVAPKTETPLGFRVGGLMVARDVNTGDVVTKGELLASLEPTSLELAVRSAQAELANAQAQLANARSSEERARAIFQGGTGTKSSLESSVQATQTAQSAVVQAQTALDKSNEDLSYAQLLATFDGIVTATSVEVGQVVSAGESVLTVAMPGERDAVIDIPEGELIPAIGDAYSILLQINPSVTSMGAVREVAPTADAATRTRRVKIALQNPPDAFRIGTTITAIRQARDVKKLFLPASAVLNQDGKTLVWIVDEKAETVRSQEVRLRDKTSAHPEVVSGLEPGTRVVIAGVHSLKEGQKIKVEGGARS